MATTVPAQDGEWLIIGTLSSDALITSSLRLDARMSASVGCSTPSFLLSSTNHSLATRRYLDQESLDDGLRLAQEKTHGPSRAVTSCGSCGKRQQSFMILLPTTFVVPAAHLPTSTLASHLHSSSWRCMINLTAATE